MRRNIVRNIKNGVKYPERFKRACLADFQSGTKSVYLLAKERNISSNTLGKWLDEAKIPRSHTSGYAGRTAAKTVADMTCEQRTKIRAEERLITVAMANMVIRKGKIVYLHKAYVPAK